MQRGDQNATSSIAACVPAAVPKLVPAPASTAVVSCPLLLAPVPPYPFSMGKRVPMGVHLLRGK